VGKKKIMIATHMNEIGMIAKYVSEKEKLNGKIAQRSFDVRWDFRL
jgi:putative aminopeptidase FrvX